MALAGDAANRPGRTNWPITNSSSSSSRRLVEARAERADRRVLIMIVNSERDTSAPS
jgi:hypothetical protein